MNELENKCALITGASRGIGAACAKVMAREGAGIIINYFQNKTAAIELSNEIQKLGRRSKIVQGDVSDQNQIKKIIKIGLEEFGKIDILVNNAGMHLRNTIPIEQLSIEDWTKSLNINLLSQFWCIQAVIEGMKKNHWGRIINISSITSQRGSISGDICYTVAKAGVNGLTKALFRQMAEYNILINTVSPGTIETPGTLAVLPNQKIINEYLKKIPIGRMGTAEETAELICFLCSERASYITGQLISVNGGAYV